jgi:glycosidase
LKNLVETAHEHGLYIILDIILNHAGNVFSYYPDRHLTEWKGNWVLEPRWDGKPNAITGLNDSTGNPTIPLGSKWQRLARWCCLARGITSP